ncbi:MAG TPA: hypothetical protein VK021_13565 [Flavobacteriaceae bacterium]|nr:hypothetical protein [Flavobacteriaceae bacterium]
MGQTVSLDVFYLYPENNSDDHWEKILITGGLGSIYFPNIEQTELHKIDYITLKL